MSSGTAAWFHEDKLEAFAAYWTVLEANYAEVVAAALREAVTFAPSLSRPDYAQRAGEEGSDVLRCVRRAIREGEWCAVEAKLEARGAAFATLGVSIEEWSDIV